MEIPKPIPFKEWIRRLEERKTRIEEDLKKVKDTKVDHPKHLEINEFIMESLEKQLENLEKTLKRLKTFVR